MTRDANDILRHEGEAALREAMDRNRREAPTGVAHANGQDVLGSNRQDGAGVANNGRAETKQQDRPPKVRLLNYSEYRQWHGSSTAGAFLIKGLVRIGTLISMNGRPGAGKTTLLIEIARCLDVGEPFLGRETKRTAVCYIAAEDEGDIVNRLEALGLENVMVVVSEEGVPLLKPDRAVAIVREAIKQARKRFPAREVFVPFDTLRAGLDGQSVLDDRYTSPALNKLRRLAEEERVVICVVNHTNRENAKQTKGETLEGVVALELILVEGSGGWYDIHVGKNRNGPSQRQIGRLRYASLEIGDIEASVVDEIEAIDGGSGPSEKGRKLGGNQALVMNIMRDALLDHGFPFWPFGADGPQVKSVRETVLRQAFIEKKSGDDRDNKRRAFSAAVDRLVLNGVLVRGENTDGEGVVWHVDKDAETGKQTRKTGNFRPPEEEP
ncbi:MAG TPA: AAA family ATPase [Rhizobiaceae bacterium]|nr:AAA family ATPase [Rhizobiaceae bacterium]